MRSAILFILFLLISSSSFANVCVDPDANSLSNDYDWLPEKDPKCLKDEIDSKPDYYVLSLSYSPVFCMEQAKGGKVPERLRFQCESKNKFYWVAHGLWAELNNPSICINDKGEKVPQHPRYCGGKKINQLTKEVIAPFMCSQPGEALLQGEWEKHGPCGDFDSPTAYFAKIKELFSKLNLPEKTAPVPELIGLVKASNPALRDMNILVENKELRICYDLKFNYISCPGESK